MTWVNSTTYQAGIDQMSTMPVLELMPSFSLGLVGWLEVIGAFLLILGFAVRWISIPLLILLALTAFAALNGQSIIDTLKELLLTHGYTDMTTSGFGKILIFLLMLLALFFMGAGRFFSVDWFLHRRLHKKVLAGQAAKAAKHAHQEVEDPFDLDNTTDENV